MPWKACGAVGEWSSFRDGSLPALRLALSVQRPPTTLGINCGIHGPAFFVRHLLLSFCEYLHILGVLQLLIPNNRQCSLPCPPPIHSPPLPSCWLQGMLLFHSRWCKIFLLFSNKFCVFQNLMLLWLSPVGAGGNFTHRLISLFLAWSASMTDPEPCLVSLRRQERNWL